MDEMQTFWAYHQDFDGHMFVSLPSGRQVQVGDHIVLRNDDGQEVEAKVISNTQWGCYAEW